MALTELTFYSNFKKNRFLAFSKLDRRKKINNQTLIIKDLETMDGFDSINTMRGINPAYANVIFYEYSYKQLTNYNLWDFLESHIYRDGKQIITNKIKSETLEDVYKKIKMEVEEIQQLFLHSVNQLYKSEGV